jgi:hypothetical protein
MYILSHPVNENKNKEREQGRQSNAAVVLEQIEIFRIFFLRVKINILIIY